MKTTSSTHTILSAARGVAAFCAVALSLVAAAPQVYAQVPAAVQSQRIYVSGGTFHIGNGSTVEDGILVFDEGKIIYCGSLAGLSPADTAGAVAINAAGKHIYPGFISINSTLGLNEIEAVRATRDFNEVGAFNPHVRTLIAYNTDSRVVPTVRSNGVLLAQVAPEGGFVSGSSSVMELDGWNWEDAARVADDAIYLNYPDMSMYSSFTRSSPQEKAKRIASDIREIENFFTEAQAYCAANAPAVPNIRFEAMRPLFEGKCRLFIRVDRAADMLSAIQFFKKFGIKPVLVGAADAWLIADILKENNIAIAVAKTHRLPARPGEDVFLPYKMPALLKEKGVLFCVTSTRGWSWQARNLPFEMGTAVAWGLSYEDAVRAMTLDAATILGVDSILGSLEEGKDATFFISEGDALDMRTNHVTAIFIRGRNTDTDNVQKQLYRKFMSKYGLEATE